MELPSGLLCDVVLKYPYNTTLEINLLTGNPPQNGDLYNTTSQMKYF